jgi:hypothetical protein
MLSFRAIARNLGFQDDEISPSGRNDRICEMTESATGHFAKSSNIIIKKAFS